MANVAKHYTNLFDLCQEKIKRAVSAYAVGGNALEFVCL